MIKSVSRVTPRSFTVLFEMTVIGPKKQRDLLLNLRINLDGCTVVSNKTVKDLGVTLDPDLSLDAHCKPVSRTGFFHLRNIAKFRSFLSKNDAEIGVLGVVGN